MMRPFILVSKFLSIAGLGFLSASALTISYATLPSLLSLPTPTDALPAFYKLKQHANAAQRLLAVSTGTLVASAYILSPRSARHPYMIYMALTVALGSYGIPKLVKIRDLESMDDLEIAEEGRGRTGSGLRINGEIVREGVEGWQRLLGWQSLSWGLGWAMGTLGLWGDGS